MATKPLSSFNNYKLKANLAYRWIILSIVISITYRIICSYIVQSLRLVWLRSHELQHARLLWPSLSPRVCSDSCQLSQWGHSTISSSVASFSPSIFPSVRVFSNVSALRIRWPKYWSFSIHPSNEYSELISFRIDWFDLAVQGTLKSLLQHHRLKASVLWHTAFFMVQLSHPYMTIEKTIALTIQTFVSKVIPAF